MMRSTAESPNWSHSYSGRPKHERVAYLRKLEEVAEYRGERLRRHRARLRARVQSAAREKRLTPEAVEAFAELHMQLDDGSPLVPADHNRLWLQLICDRHIRRLLIIAPPESAKTTWLIAYLGCRIGIWPEDNVILGSVSDTVAERRSLALRAMVQSDEWRQTFPDVAPVKAAGGGFTWGTREWSMATGGVPRRGRIHPSVSSYGVGASIIGSRADEAIGDDLLDFDSTRTQHQRETGHVWAHNSLISRVKSRVGRVVIIGNQWHADDLYGTFEDQGNFVVCRAGILSETDDVHATLIYPDNWPHPMLGEPIGEAA